MRAPGPQESAVAALTAFIDRLDELGRPEEMADLDWMLADTDLHTMTVLAALVIQRVGQPGRDALQHFGCNVARNMAKSEGAS
jgi:hypothetical protein